jgi:hypothetical protein
MPVKRIDMAIHVQELCAKHNIKVSYQSLEDPVPEYWASPKTRRIHIRPTKNTGHYVSALHEIGHIVGTRQNGPLLTRELYAWIWARENAIVWTDTAERIMRKAMDSYRWRDQEKEIWEIHTNPVAII